MFFTSRLDISKRVSLFVLFVVGRTINSGSRGGRRRRGRDGLPWSKEEFLVRISLAGSMCNKIVQWIFFYWIEGPASPLCGPWLIVSFPPVIFIMVPVPSKIPKADRIKTKRSHPLQPKPILNRARLTKFKKVGTEKNPLSRVSDKEDKKDWTLLLQRKRKGIDFLKSTTMFAQ